MLRRLRRTSLCKLSQTSNNYSWIQNTRAFSSTTEQNELTETAAAPQPKQDKEELTAMFTQIHSRKIEKVSSRKPAFPYDPILSIETPSLLWHMQQLQTNINSMNDYLDTNKLLLRPSIHTHKTSDMIQLQFKMHNSNAPKQRMNGIVCPTISEAELLVNSGINFMCPNIDYKIRDVLLSHINTDLQKMWRFVQLYDTTVQGMRLSTVVDDIFQIHLWNYTMEELKKTNQTILSSHTSSHSDGSMHQSTHLRLGIMLCLKSSNEFVGINVGTEDGIQSLKEILSIMGGDYRNNLYLRGFYIDKSDKIAQEWLLNEENQSKIEINSYFDKLYIANVNEIYDSQYVFDNGALTLLSTIENIYSEGSRFIHVLDCGYNSYASVPVKVGRYHRPTYALQSDPSLSAVVLESEFNKYEIANHRNDAYNTFLVCDTELEVGGKIELLIPPNDAGYSSTVNLYDFCVVINEEKPIVDWVWQIDARGPGN